MGWKVRAEEVRRALELREQGPSDVWWVCEDYEIRQGRIEAAYPEFWLDYRGISLPDASKVIDQWSPYRPLKDAPELFLEFARLSEATDFNESVLAFCRKYGVPGSAYASEVEYPHGTDLAVLARNSEQALRLLEMYEAVIGQDSAKADSLLREYYSDISPPSEEELTDWSTWDPTREVLECVAVTVALRVRSLCVPHLEIEEAMKQPRVDPSKVEAGWSFNNLLGAAYLQMYSLMASANDLKRCEYCGRLISLARHQSKKRKSRNDKRFCNDACRQAKHRSRKGRRPSAP